MEEQERAQYEQRISDLESELAASIHREELLTNPGKFGSLKTSIKRTRFGRVLANPSTLPGKIIRAPRSAARILRRPAMLKDIHKTRKKKPALKPGQIPPAVIISLETIVTTDSPKRLNLVIDSLASFKDDNLVALKYALDFAKATSSRLRIITCSESTDPLKFTQILKDNSLKLASLELEFYSTLDQAQKGEKQYLLEVGSEDRFLNLIKANNVD